MISVYSCSFFCVIEAENSSLDEKRSSGDVLVLCSKFLRIVAASRMQLTMRRHLTQNSLRSVEEGRVAIVLVKACTENQDQPVIRVIQTRHKDVFNRYYGAFGSISACRKS